LIRYTFNPPAEKPIKSSVLKPSRSIPVPVTEWVQRSGTHSGLLWVDPSPAPYRVASAQRSGNGLYWIDTSPVSMGWISFLGLNKGRTEWRTGLFGGQKTRTRPSAALRESSRAETAPACTGRPCRPRGYPTRARSHSLLRDSAPGHATAPSLGIRCFICVCSTRSAWRRICNFKSE